MPESPSHKKYMERYRARKKQEKANANKSAQESTSAAPEWRTRRHAKRKPDGEWSTDYLFERRNQLSHRSETTPLDEEEQALKDLIDEELRSRGELARAPSSEPLDTMKFYQDLYARLDKNEEHRAQDEKERSKPYRKILISHYL